MASYGISSDFGESFYFYCLFVCSGHWMYTAIALEYSLALMLFISSGDIIFPVCSPRSEMLYDNLMRARPPGKPNPIGADRKYVDWVLRFLSLTPPEMNMGPNGESLPLQLPLVHSRVASRLKGASS